MSPQDPATEERLTHADVGLDDDAPIPFHFDPGAPSSPLVVSFPHVGRRWPALAGPRPQASFPANSDYEVHTLFRGLPRLGVASLRAVFSRMAVDLNRAEDDIAPDLVPDHPQPRPRGPAGGRPTPGLPGRPGVGVVWARAVGDVALLRDPLPLADFRRRIELLHRPYHRALRLLLERRRRRFGHAILLDAHSMPGHPGADLVVGDAHGRTCAGWVRDIALSALADATRGGLRVALNSPYPGGEIVQSLGRPARGVHALQVEVRRGLYMDERRQRLYGSPPVGGSKLPGAHPALGPALRALVEALAGATPPAARPFRAQPSPLRPP